MDEYKFWEESPYLGDENSLELIGQIVAKYFMFRNVELNSENSAIIVFSLIEYGQRFKFIKIHDLQNALKLNTSIEEKNISAAYFIDVLKKYFVSDFRKNLQKIMDEKLNKIALPKPELTEQNILDLAKTNIGLIEDYYNKTGCINLTLSKRQIEILESNEIITTDLDQEEIEKHAIEYAAENISRKAIGVLDNHILNLCNDKIRNIINKNISKMDMELIVFQYKLKCYFDKRININK